MIWSRWDTEASACQKPLWNNLIIGCQEVVQHNVRFPLLNKLPTWHGVSWLLSLWAGWYYLMFIGVGLYLSAFVGAYKHTWAVEVHNKNIRTFWVSSNVGNIIWVAVRWYLLPQGSYTRHILSYSASEVRSLQPEKVFYTWTILCPEGQYGDATHKIVLLSMSELCELALFPDPS